MVERPFGRGFDRRTIFVHPQALRTVEVGLENCLSIARFYAGDDLGEILW
jgi:hypothetical protein